MPKVTDEYLRERRDAIVHAAMALFARRGYAGTTMRMIGAEARVSVGAISNYFPSKAGIVEASNQAAADHYLAPDRVRLLPGESAADYLSRLCESTEHDADSDLDFSRLSVVTWGESMTSDEIRSAMVTVFRGLQLAIRDQLVELQEQGKLAPDLDVEAASVLIQALGNGYLLHSQVLGEAPAVPVADLIKALVLPTPAT